MSLQDLITYKLKQLSVGGLTDLQALTGFIVGLMKDQKTTLQPILDDIKADKAKQLVTSQTKQAALQAEADSLNSITINQII